MPQVVEEFNAMDIVNASIQFFKNGERQPGTKFGCVGTVTVEPETTPLTKRCGRKVMREKTVTTKLNVTVSAHIDVPILRDIFGLKNKDLKTGIYSYGTDSIGYEFVWTADVVDLFDDVTKLIAFPRASSSTGLTINIDTSQEEVALVELSFSAVADEQGEFYYEAFTSELEDETVAEQWHTQFTRTLVEATTSGNGEEEPETP